MAYRSERCRCPSVLWLVHGCATSPCSRNRMAERFRSASPSAPRSRMGTRRQRPRRPGHLYSSTGVTSLGRGLTLICPSIRRAPHLTASRLVRLSLCVVGPPFPDVLWITRSTMNSLSDLTATSHNDSGRYSLPRAWRRCTRCSAPRHAHPPGYIQSDGPKHKRDSSSDEVRSSVMLTFCS